MARLLNRHHNQLQQRHQRRHPLRHAIHLYSANSAQRNSISLNFAGQLVGTLHIRPCSVASEVLNLLAEERSIQVPPAEFFGYAGKFCRFSKRKA